MHTSARRIPTDGVMNSMLFGQERWVPRVGSGRSLRIQVDTGSYDRGGQTASLERTRLLKADPGSFAVDGRAQRVHNSPNHPSPSRN